MTKQNLFHKNEALTPKGQIVSTTFRDMIKNYLMEQSDKFSTIELEVVCVSELHCLMAEIRLLKQIRINKSTNERMWNQFLCNPETDESLSAE